MKNNIYQKLSKASGKFVKKDDKKNGMHFNPLSHDAVQRVALKALAEENLYPYCTYKNFLIQDNFVCTTCVMTIVDLDYDKESVALNIKSTDKIVIETHAIAKADKYGSGNAMSYARKYAFLNALNLKTGLEDEQEEAIDSEDGFPAEPLIVETTHPVPKLHIFKNDEKIDDLYIATKLEVIENNKDKKNSTALRSDLENLKTRRYKANKWDSFVKSNLYKKYFTLQNKHKPKRS